MSISPSKQAATLQETGAEPTIVLRDISKWFGNVVAVNDVSLYVYPGITGLLGPNGAGKTTLLHMIAGLARPSKGEIKLLGESPQGNYHLNRRIGVMTEHESVYGFYTGREFIEFSGQLYGITPLETAVERAIEAVGLKESQDRPLDTYSRGMKQRMRLAAALVHDPEVLILDEPLSGTDPRQRLEFHELMSRLSGEGRTILISSHILEEIETLAERILLMVSGKLAASGDFHTIRARLDERPYRIRILTSDPRSMASAMVQMETVDSVTVDEEGSLTVLTSDVISIQLAVPRLAKERNIRLFRFEPLDDSLESVFSYIVDR